MRRDREKWEAERQADEAKRAEQAQADAKAQETFRQTNAYLKVRPELNKEQSRLDFVLKNGLPTERDGQYRFHGWSHLGWFKTQREAIDAAVIYPPEGEERT
ncbi:hypothetical protein A9R05_01230 [Burkholderia sp. KK1]|nr:hypothetical protein A9R05_01230 [Burkholderia sp. KK1]